MPLGELCSLITDGKHGDCQNEVDSGFYFLSVKDLDDGRLMYGAARQITQHDFLETHSRTRLEPGDVLFTNTGTIGRVAIAPEDSRTPRTTFQKSVAILKPKRDCLNPHFLFYLLKFESARLSEIAAGTTQRNLLLKDIRSFLVRVPALELQRAIAANLRPFDDKIELNRRMNQTLEEIARALFKFWFVDFGPVRAKAEGRWKKGESLPGMPADMWDLWPSEFEESEIGEIPKGWCVRPLTEEATFVRGVSYRSEDLAESQTALVSLKCAGREGVYHEGGLKPYRGEFKEDQIVQPGDVVVSHTDVTQRAEVIGRAYQVRPSSRFSRLVASLDMAVVRPKGESETREYLAHSLSTERFIDHAYGYTNGTTVLHLSSQALPDYPHLVPPPGLVWMFTEIASPLHRKVGEAGLESNALSKIRDALLPKLLSGEIRVPVNGGR